ncbi:MAG: acetylxylan esterase [Acidobacteriota bacterium]
MQESKQQVTAYLVREARAITDRAAEEIRSVETWEKLRARRLEETRHMLGLLPWPPRTPLRVQAAGVLDKGEYTVEKIAFQSLPDFYVTANLYVPKQREGRLPAIVYVCGHSHSPYGAKAEYQRHGISLARNGYVAIILDPIQIAELYAMHHGLTGQEMPDWYSRGYTPAGVEVWNAMRAIDYLETRPEVDAARIGMTGRSGGAAMSWFTAAVDPRVKAAVPVMGISTYAANVRENTQRLHCDCMFLINTFGHDMIHQGALIAPRPLLMAHGRKDALFPVAGYKEFEEKVGALYRAYGRADDFRNIEVDTAHQDSDYLREQAIRWFDRYLKNTPERKLAMDYTNAPGESLAVFGGKPPAAARNFRVHEILTAGRPSPRYASLGKWEARRKELLALLRANVFGALPEKPDEWTLRQSGKEELEIVPAGGVPLRALLRRPAKPDKPLPALLYVASDGEDAQTIFQLLRGPRTGGHVQLALYPRGAGEVPWEKSFWRATLRNAMHVGQTVDSMRLADVLLGLEVLRKQPGVDPDRILVLGQGVAGVLGLYAAILEPRLHQVMLIDPPSSHVEGPIFLNVLRYTDLPEAAALLAPRRLSFYARMPAAYLHTRHVYALYGKPDDLFLSMHIDGVLEGRYDHGFASGR